MSVGLGSRLRPATPGWGVVVCVFVCLLPLYPPLLAGARGVGVCVLVRASAALRHSWLGCWGVCVMVWALPLDPATPCWGLRCGCVCLGWGFGCAPPLLAGMCGLGVCVWAGDSAAPHHSLLRCWGVRVCVHAPLVPRHSWLGCAVWVCVFGFGFRLPPCLSWLGCWDVCVLVCALCLYPPPLGGVCGVGVGVWAWVLAAPRHSSLGCWGVRVCVRVPPVLRNSWLGCAVWVSVLGLGFLLRPAPPGWGVGVCVCWCGHSPCTPPLLAGVCGVGVGVWAQVFRCAPPLLAGLCGCVCVCVCAPPVPRHSWLGCAAWVCVFGVGFRLRPATPGLGVAGCVRWCARSACPLPLLARVCGVGVCVMGSDFGCAPPLLAGVLGCACWCACSPCTPPLLTGVCGVGVRVWALVSAAPRHSWLQCCGLCALVCALRLSPATPGSGVRCGCMCLGSGLGCALPLLAGFLGCACRCACSPCTAPLLARVCGLGVCARARVSAVSRHSWLGFVVCGLAVSWNLFLWRGSLRVVCAAQICGTRWPLLLGTFSCALVVACDVPLWRASWPRVGAPRFVRSGCSRCSGRLSRRRGAFPHPRLYWVAARGTRRPAWNRAHCACRWPPPRLGR